LGRGDVESIQYSVFSGERTRETKVTQVAEVRGQRAEADD